MLLTLTTALSIGLAGLSLGAVDADPPATPDQALARARVLWQTGKYAESDEAYAALAKQPAAWTPATQAAIARGRSLCALSQGELVKARGILLAEVLRSPTTPNPDLWALLANLQLQRGAWEAAESAVNVALKANPDHWLGRWVRGRLHEVRGQAAEARATWKWFVEARNAQADAVRGDADALLLIAQAAEKYYRTEARGRELSEALNDVINQLYEGALKADPNCWQAPWLEGRLFLSGYDERAAMPELQKALRINPLAVEVLVTLGQADLQGYKLAAGRQRVEDALDINPHYQPAMVLLADLNISDERFDDARDAARKAVAENPRDEDGLARLAAAYRLKVEPLAAESIELAVQGRNPRPATFFAALAERLADRRKYRSAERAFLKAIEADPLRADARIGLGMLYMQIGREAEARDLFADAFAADPFNVRANNMIEVLKHLTEYQTIETDHYRVLIEPGQDALTGKYMSQYLESVHKELVDRFGFSPPGKTQIEILKSHRWFSARTIGLPFIPTVGACTGKVVALASPAATRQPFNWARVLKHEVVHVITLQQTEFNIPHWYTEALAVESEGYPRPQPWNRLLIERVPSRTKLLNLDTINLGFIRPKEPDDRQMAYCQAQLYAQYMLKRFGPDALIKLLMAYRRGLTTPEAIPECFKVEVKDFEAEYLTFLDGVVKTINARVSEEKQLPFSKLESLLEEKPDDPDLNARMAYEHLARRDYKEARPFADKARKLKPNHPLATYVKARLFLLIGDEDTAREILEPAFDPKEPNERVIDLLAELQMKAGKLDEAEKLYEIARQGDPAHTKWIAGLTRIHLRQDRPDKLLHDLELLAANEADDLDVRKELAKRYAAAGKPEAAARWARECLYIDVMDIDAHLLLADASVASKAWDTAIDEYQAVLTELRPKAAQGRDIRVKLARALVGAGRREDARAALDAVLKSDPEHPEALKLRDEIGR